MRYLVVGAGAIGATIGARLAQAGHDVVLVARGPHLQALQETGLRLATPSGTEVLRLPTVDGPGALRGRPGDVLMLCVKTQDTASVLDALASVPVVGTGLQATSLPIVCAQNGVENERLALRRWSSVYGMRVWLPATHLEPGVVLAPGAPISGLLDLGRYPAGVDGLAQQVASDLSASSFRSEAIPDVMRWKYGKLLSNLANGLEALCGGAGVDAGPPPWDDLRRAATAEGLACFEAAGIDCVSRAEELAHRADQVEVRPVEGAERGGGSTWQSLSRGTGSTEVDYLNGEIALLGRLWGVPTPVNAAIQQLVAAAAREGRRPGSTSVEQVRAAAAARVS